MRHKNGIKVIEPAEAAKQRPGQEECQPRQHQREGHPHGRQSAIAPTRFGEENPATGPCGFFGGVSECELAISLDGLCMFFWYFVYFWYFLVIRFGDLFFGGIWLFF